MAQEKGVMKWWGEVGSNALTESLVVCCKGEFYLYLRTILLNPYAKLKPYSNNFLAKFELSYHSENIQKV